MNTAIYIACLSKKSDMYALCHWTVITAALMCIQFLLSPPGVGIWKIPSWTILKPVLPTSRDYWSGQSPWKDTEKMVVEGHRHGGSVISTHYSLDKRVFSKAFKVQLSPVRDRTSHCLATVGDFNVWVWVASNGRFTDSLSLRQIFTSFHIKKVLNYTKLHVYRPKGYTMEL